MSFKSQLQHSSCTKERASDVVSKSTSQGNSRGKTEIFGKFILVPDYIFN